MSRAGTHLASGPALLLLHGVKLEARASVAAAVRMHSARLALLIEGIRQRLQEGQQCSSDQTSPCLYRRLRPKDARWMQAQRSLNSAASRGC